MKRRLVFIACLLASLPLAHGQQSRVQQILAEEEARQARKLFDHFMVTYPTHCELAELKPDAFKVWLKTQSLNITEVKVRQGIIPLDKILLVSPNGIKAMTDRGIEVVAWDAVTDDIPSRLGWTERVKERYDAQKKMDIRAGNSAAAQTRVAAAHQAATGSSVSTASSPAFIDMVQTKRPFPADVSAEITKRANLKWPKDYDMQVYEIQNQTQALAKFNVWRRDGIAGLPLSVSEEIMRASWDKWGCQFDMVIYNAENQSAAWLKLNGR
jgi:hypothetical protein